MGNKHSGSDWAMNNSSQSTRCSRSTERKDVIWLAVELQYQQPFTRIVDCAFNLDHFRNPLIQANKVCGFLLCYCGSTETIPYMASLLSHYSDWLQHLGFLSWQHWLSQRKHSALFLEFSWNFLGITLLKYNHERINNNTGVINNHVSLYTNPTHTPS